MPVEYRIIAARRDFSKTDGQGLPAASALSLCAAKVIFMIVTNGLSRPVTVALLISMLSWSVKDGHWLIGAALRSTSQLRRKQKKPSAECGGRCLIRMVASLMGVIKNKQLYVFVSHSSYVLTVKAHTL